MTIKQIVVKSKQGNKSHQQGVDRQGEGWEVARFYHKVGDAGMQKGNRE